MLEITVIRYLELPIKILRREPTLDFSGTKDENCSWLRIKGKHEQEETSKKFAFQFIQKAFRMRERYKYNKGRKETKMIFFSKYGKGHNK